MWPWSWKEKTQGERTQQQKKQEDQEAEMLRWAALEDEEALRWVALAEEDETQRWTARDDAAMVRELLKKRGMDVNARDELGITPLHKAASEGRLEVIEFLLRVGADVGVADATRETPLHKAAAAGHLQVIELLLEASPYVDAADMFGRTPLHTAFEAGHLHIMEILLKDNSKIDQADRSGETLLHKASSQGHAQVAEILLKANPNVDVTDMDRRTALHKALAAGHLQVVEMLLKANPNVNAAAKHAPYSWNEARALALCISLWTQELANDLPFTDVPIEVARRGVESTQAYIDSLKRSCDTILRRKICLVGPSCAGKTSFVKSIVAKQPELEHLDDRTIGIDHFPLRFEQPGTKHKDVTIHEVTFWDFAGQDAYQVAHSLFFSPRALFLVCVDLEAFIVAFLQASIMSNMKKQETQLMDEFIERTVMHWIRMIVARQPNAEFVFIVTKGDLLKENTVTERLFKTTLVAKLKDVEATVQHVQRKEETTASSPDEHTAVRVTGPNIVFVSCTSSESVETARAVVEGFISTSDRSFHMPDTYTQALEAIVTMRVDAKSHDIGTRINRMFAPVDTLPAMLKIEHELEPELSKIILQTLHDLGDVLWFEDLGVKLFQDRVILDPLLLIDFIRQVINHNYTGQTMPHTDLKTLPYWNGLTNKEQMSAMKQVLQKFNLVYSADDDRTMSWDSDLIVPAYWQTKTPAAWLWLGDILRINPTKIGPRREQLALSDILGSIPRKPNQGEAVRVHWEFHFEFGLPSALFDQVVVASVSPFFTFDAGPDWIVYEEEDATACRLMVGRDPTSLHRTIHAEALVADAASPSQADELWESFEQLVGAFMSVLREYPGLDVSSFAWDNAHKKIGLKRLAQSRTVPSKCAKWMPPAKHWTSIQNIIRQRVSSEE